MDEAKQEKQQGPGQGEGMERPGCTECGRGELPVGGRGGGRRGGEREGRVGGGEEGEEVGRNSQQGAGTEGGHRGSQEVADARRHLTARP